jgi:O-antigen/teichoic acid export membrane protein
MSKNFKNAVYNAIGYIFPVVVSLITTPYIVHKLNTDIYGIYVLAISLMGMLSFLDLGFGQGIIKFVSHYEAKKDFKRINQIVNLSLLINTVMGLVGGLVIFYFSNFLSRKVFKVRPEQIELAITSFKIVSIGFVLNLISSTFSNIPRALQRYDISVKIQNTVWFLFVISSVILLYFGYGLVEMLTFYVIFQFIGLTFYIWLSKKLIPELSLSLKFNKDIFKEVFGFNIYAALNNTMSNIIFRIDKMIIAYFIGTSAVTYYQIPFTIVQMANGFLSSLTQHLFPFFSYLNSCGKTEQIKNYFKKSTGYAFFIGLLINSIFMIYGHDFLKIWMGEEFAEKGGSVISIISCVFLLLSIGATSIRLLDGMGFIGLNTLNAVVGGFFYIIFLFLLVPTSGAVGAAKSFCFVLIPYPLYIFFLSKILDLSMKWFYSLYFRVMIIIFILFFIFNGFHFKIKSLFDLALNIFILMFAVIIISLFFRLVNFSTIIKTLRGLKNDTTREM